MEVGDFQAQPPPPPPPQQLPLQQQLHVGQETIVGPGPAPPLLTTTDAGSLLVRAGHKRYFFDACSSPHGEFVRITEVTNPPLLWEQVSVTSALLILHVTGVKHRNWGPY